MDILSTKGVSAMVGVSEATVKRWADAGTLLCFRTPGGHRKFRIRDVKAFLSDQKDEPAPSLAAPMSLLDEPQRDARALALAGDVDGLVSLVASRRLAGITLARVFDEVISPALHDIGEGWAASQISAAQEHIAAVAVGDMLARVRPLVERSTRADRGRALCACMPGEQHDLAVRMVALVLVSEGYRAAILGANVPAGDLALMVAGNPPALLALSASVCADAERLRGDVSIIASAAHAARTQLVVGGKGFDQVRQLPGQVVHYRSLQDLAASLTAPAPPTALPVRARSAIAI